jgi:hypothetical protein
MRKLRTLTRRRLISVLSLIFVLALTTTTALAARPRFSSAIAFTLAAPSGGTGQALTIDLYTGSDDHPIALVASGQLSDLVVGQKYELVINAKGKAEVVCKSDDDDYHGSSPKTVDVTASGSTKFSASSDHKSFSFDADEIKLDSKRVCSSDYGNNNHKQRVTILKVMYSSGDVSLFESKGKNKDAVEIGSFALNGHDKDKKVDQVKFSKCKTKDLNVYCKQNGGG